jgi:hypothetical protein
MAFDVIDDPEGDILQFVAEQQVKTGISPNTSEMAENYLSSIGVPPTPHISLLATKGLQALLRDSRAHERLYMKTLELDPGFYSRMIEERAKVDPKKEKAAAWHRANRQRKFDEKQAVLRSIADEGMRKMRAAFEFYERWHLPDGTPLGDATKSKLIAEANRERAAADGHIKNATFYEALADKIDGDQTVRTIPLEEAHRIREQVFITEAA